jgi:hypothetical protein
VITEYPLGSGIGGIPGGINKGAFVGEAPNLPPYGIAPGSDGNVWFTIGQNVEVQTVPFTGATGGTFTLTCDGGTTGPITYSGNNSTRRTNILNELKAKCGENFESPGAATNPTKIAFVGKYAGQDLPPMTCDPTNLLPAGTATCTVNTLSDGAGSAIGRITPSGTITEFSAGLNAGSRPRSTPRMA